MGFRPVYGTYVDAVIEHLGGKSFRETAVEELLARVAKVVKPSCWSKVKTELKKDKIVFPEIIRFDDFTCNTTSAKSITTTVESWKPYARVLPTVRMTYCAVVQT